VRKVRVFVRQRTDAKGQFVPNGGCLNLLENHMYLGGGILGTILIIAIIFYLVRRA
jgi:hypothetical protein